MANDNLKLPKTINEIKGGSLMNNKKYWYMETIEENEKMTSVLYAYTEYSPTFSKSVVNGMIVSGVVFNPRIHFDLEVFLEGEVTNKTEYSFCIHGFSIGGFAKTCRSIKAAISSSAEKAATKFDIFEKLKEKGGAYEDNIDEIQECFYSVFKEFKQLVSSYPLKDFGMVDSFEEYEHYKSAVEKCSKQCLDLFHGNREEYIG